MCQSFNKVQFNLIFYSWIGCHHWDYDIKVSNQNLSCYKHDICWIVLQEEIVLRIRKDKIINKEGKEATAGFIWDSLLSSAISPRLCNQALYEVLLQVTKLKASPEDAYTKGRKHHQNMWCAIAVVISTTISLLIHQENPWPVYMDPSSEKQKKGDTTKDKWNWTVLYLSHIFKYRIK